MELETTSKNIDGITDLVVVAPIRDGFIQAYENVTYGTRLKLVAEALNRIRITAREHETILPFSDVTERILTLLDFRVGIIDKDLFSLPAHRRGKKQAGATASGGPQSQRFLYLTATFDGAWEPYMRLIWKPLGPFLDLLFCNCEGYVTASEHSFEEYAQWVRDNQMDSAIFYTTTGLTIRDHLYLNRLEYLQRSQAGPDADQSIARLTMPQPERAAKAERQKALADLANKDPQQYGRIHEQALEVLTVLYRLADYYPPEWLVGRIQKTRGCKRRSLREGQYLARVAHDLLLGWEELIPGANDSMAGMWQKVIVPAYRDPLHWFDTGGKHLAAIVADREKQRPADPVFDPSEAQAGILSPLGTRDAPARTGVLMLMTVTDAAAARAFLTTLDIAFEGTVPADGFYRTIGLTSDGLRRLGLATGVINRFPKEFREGMSARSGLMGDMRENHPREWALPARNWPPPSATESRRPPVELSEIDVVLQIRAATASADDLMADVARLAGLAEDGLALVAYEPMTSDYLSNGAFRDHFGFHDGISQPKPVAAFGGGARDLDEVKLGEIVLGYANDRDDDAPQPFASEKGSLRWRAKLRAQARACQHNGTFLVIRKLEQHVATFNAFITAETARINADHPALPAPMTEARLKALMLGREVTGQPLEPAGPKGLNDFDYAQDTDGTVCPFAAHVRRANPRDMFQGRRTPRILRRGMSFDHRDPVSGQGPQGLVFMAYNASIAEQYETIQRWLNGGNSTFVGSAHADPLFGVAPRSGAMDQTMRTFRFVEGTEVVRVAMPDPFVSLHWGLYLFVPSRTALASLFALTGAYRPMDGALETRGEAVIDRLSQLSPDQQGAEWKRLLEDFDAKDPSERNISPDMWSAIRWEQGGSVRIDGGMPLVHDWTHAPLPDQPINLSASRRHVRYVLADWKAFSTEEQLRRIKGNSGPIYVTQQPDNQYKNRNLRGKYDYRKESEATNAILMSYDEEAGFQAGYAAASAVLKGAKVLAAQIGRDYFEIELRRQFLLPALGGLCRLWYGLPDGTHMLDGAWLWEPPAARTPPGARCPADFLSPSRNAFYPRPSDTVGFFAGEHGAAILAASLAFVKDHRPDGANTGTIAAEMFKAIPNDQVLARNLIGTMVGAIPPMDGNLRGILLEWLSERTLWRNQAALHRGLGGVAASSNPAAACAILRGAVSQAMCKRPAPDLLYRTALSGHVDGKPLVLKARGKDRSKDIRVGERDLMVVSLVSVAQRSLLDGKTPDGNVSIVFGGNRRAAWQADRRALDHPVHACPAQAMAMGAIMGIMAALLDTGRILALPASLIVRVSDWR